MKWKLGVRYLHGKILVYKANEDGTFQTTPNPGNVAPSWAVDIREIIAMTFAGVGALLLLWKGDVHDAMYLLIALTSYATGRTVPGGKQVVYKQREPIVNSGDLQG